MGTYNLSKDEIKGKFKGWIENQEGEIHADVMAETWNELTDEYHWNKLAELKEGFIAFTKSEFITIVLSSFAIGISATAIFYNTVIL